MHSDTPFQAADIVRTRAPGRAPQVALILGSGLGALANHIDDAITIPYDNLPGFPARSVQGHAGELVLGKLAGVPVACMKGRGHYYEGHGAGVMTIPVRTLKLLGCEAVCITNAVGSLRWSTPTGSLVAIADHINLLPGAPLAGPNDDRFGPRFFSMANAYDRDLRKLLHEIAADKGIALHEGTFCCCPGPNFETAAEIRMLDRLGADVVGMSLVPEVIAARHCGLRVAAVSVVTNMAEGLTDILLSHEQTLAHAAVGLRHLTELVLGLMERLPIAAATHT